MQRKSLIRKPIKCKSNNYFGTTLREIRMEKGLTQEESAELLNCTQAQWSAYELGKSRPNLDMIILIAQGLKISPLDMLSRSIQKSNFFVKKSIRRVRKEVIV